MAFKIDQWAYIGAVAGALNVVLLWLVGFITPLAPYVTGITPELGARLGTGGARFVQILSGVVPFVETIPAILIAALSGAVMIYLGKWLYTTLPFKMKDRFWKVALILVYAAVAAGIILGTMQFGNYINLIIGLAINSIVTAAFIVYLLADYAKIIKIPNG